MTSEEIIAEFLRDEVKKTFNKTVVKDAFIVGYAMLRSCATPKLGEQLIPEGSIVSSGTCKILTFHINDLPGIDFLQIKELSNLGFRVDDLTKRIAYIL